MQAVQAGVGRVGQAGENVGVSEMRRNQWITPGGHIDTSTVNARAAWVNWNPDPQIHAFGTMIQPQGIMVAMCRVVVREARGVFDPDAPKACPTCADDVRHGRTWDDVKDRQMPIPPNAIVCRRGSR